jgi:hypothetical protein
MYNFSNVAEFVGSDGAEGKPTVEFRQHECVVDAEATGCWVRFVEGVVRKAEEMAGMEKQKAVEDLEVKDVKGFLEWIGLEECDRMYWIKRSDCWREE